MYRGYIYSLVPVGIVLLRNRVVMGLHIDTQAARSRRKNSFLANLRASK